MKNNGPTETGTGNFEASIHDENYLERFETPLIRHETMVFMGGRSTEKLNGFWTFVPDQYDTGLRDNWHIPRVPDGTGTIPPWDYADTDGMEVQLPSCWNTLAPEFRWYEGSAWFARRFRYHARAGNERVVLRVGAANYDTWIFINHTYLGRHRGGSTPFFVEITDVLQEDNVIQLCINNSRSTDRVPMRNTDWFNWGGVYRDIELVRLPPTFIEDFRVHMVPDGRQNRIHVSAAIRGDKNGRVDAETYETLRFTIPELEVDEQIVLDPETGTGELEIECSPDLWSPDNPRLYDVEVSIGYGPVNDRITDRVGFREIRIEGTEIMLNGRPIWLRGVSVHEDDVEHGKLSSRDDIERRFAHARELGCNFMRLAHYPHHELAARIADQVGLLLWEEIPVYWAIDFSNPETYSDAQNQLRELIRRDYNRASVVIWSVGNENADTDARLSFMSNLAETVRQDDPSRLVSAACLVNHEKNRIEDRLSEYLDVIGLNEYYGWYKTDFDELVDLGRNSRPGKPVIISEFGAGSKAGHHGSVSDKFTEEYAEHLYERQIETIRALDYVRGITPWILYDFACPRRYNRYQQGFNRKGLIAEDKRTRKLPFFVLQRFYRELADALRSP